MDDEWGGATTNLNFLRSCLLKLHARAGQKDARYDEFAIVDLTESLQTACGIYRVADSSKRSPSPVAHIADMAEPK